MTDRFAPSTHELLTRFALDELPESERDMVESELAVNDEGRIKVEELRHLADRLREASDSELLPKTCPELRQAIKQRLDEVEKQPATGKKPWWRMKKRELFAIVAVSLCLVLLLTPAIQMSREAARRTQGNNNMRQMVLGFHGYYDTYEYSHGFQSEGRGANILLGDGSGFDGATNFIAISPDGEFAPSFYGATYDGLSNTILAGEMSPNETNHAWDRGWSIGQGDSTVFLGPIGAPVRGQGQPAENYSAADVAAAFHSQSLQGHSILGDLYGPHFEHMRIESYAEIIENEFVKVDRDDAISTFSIDVDTASYSNVRRFLNQGQLPPAQAVRVEEFVNYFDYDYPQPQSGEPFSVNMEVAKCPWQLKHKLLRIGLKGRDIELENRSPSNLVFLIDVSGSMASPEKLPLLQESMKLLVNQLDQRDRVTIVTYAGNAGLRLPPTSDKRKIKAAIDGLTSGGSTHGSAGIQMAYDQAVRSFLEDGTNRVILATDGDLNVGVTDNNELIELIKEKAASGVFLTVLGFGTGNLKDHRLESLADNGNGMYAYIDQLREGRRVLVRQLTGSLVTIAKDVKIQVEFNPAAVAAYRLIGYENRVMAAEDFDDDTKDAGEIGAGHTVTALYELVLADGKYEAGQAKEVELARPLKYQHSTVKVINETRLTDAAKSDELLTISLRYKEPNADESQKIEYSLKNSSTRFSEASGDFQFASAVAAFGMLLRDSKHCGDVTCTTIEEIAAGALGKDPHGDRYEFLELVRRAEELGK